MSWFDRFLRRRRQAGPPGGASTPRGLAELREFTATRAGVEAYIEPPTAVYSTTLCLVAADGEYLRRPVRDERHAARFAKDQGIPLYDARKVGYPRRMRNYDKGRRGGGIGLEDLPPLETTDERGES